MKRNFDLIEFNQAAAVVDMNVKARVNKAIQLAIEQAEGATVPAKTVLDRPVPVAANLHDPKPFNEPRRSSSKEQGAE